MKKACVLTTNAAVYEAMMTMDNVTFVLLAEILISRIQIPGTHRTAVLTPHSDARTRLSCKSVPVGEPELHVEGAQHRYP